MKEGYNDSVKVKHGFCPYCGKSLKVVGVWQKKTSFFITIADVKNCTKVFAIHELMALDWFDMETIKWIQEETQKS